MCTDNISQTECTIFVRHPLHLICAFTHFCMGKECNKLNFELKLKFTYYLPVTHSVL